MATGESGIQENIMLATYLASLEVIGRLRSEAEATLRESRLCQGGLSHCDELRHPEFTTNNVSWFQDTSLAFCGCKVCTAEATVRRCCEELVRLRKQHLGV